MKRNTQKKIFGILTIWIGIELFFGVSGFLIAGIPAALTAMGAVGVICLAIALVIAGIEIGDL